MRVTSPRPPPPGSAGVGLDRGLQMCCWIFLSRAALGTAPTTVSTC